MDTKKKKNSSGLITFLAIAFVLILIVIISSSGLPGETISYTEAQKLINNGEVTHMYVQSNGVAVIRKQGSEIDEASNSKYSSKYVYGRQESA